MNDQSVSTARRTSRVLAGALACLSLPVLAMTTATQADARPCDPEYFYKTTALGKPGWDALSVPAGKNNASTSPAPLTYTLSTTEAASSTAEVGAEAKVGFAMAEVKASLKISSTLSIAKSTTVTDTLVVPGKHRGFEQVGILRQRFNITRWQRLPNCSEKQGSFIGNYNLIVAWPHFAQCITTAASCKPLP